MKILNLILFFFTSIMFAQEISTITNLSNTIDETSGLIFINGKLITHNDSGNEAILYEIDTITGEISRTVVVENATNTDWEDITVDENSIFIGDFGNNLGMRTDLKIYRIDILDYFTNDTVNAELISFSYNEQTNFTNQIYAHNYDAEALISIEDSLYIFTKNWLNLKSDIYSLSKNPGTYSVTKIDQLETSGLVTGADYNPLTNKLILIGYSFLDAFIVHISEFENLLFSNGILNKTTLNIDESIQIEGICIVQDNQYFLSSETHTSGFSSLYKLDTQDLTVDNIITEELTLSPNPTRNHLEIKGIEIQNINIYNSFGILVLQSYKNTLNTSHLASGLYIVKIQSKKGITSFKRLMIQ